MNKRRIIFTVAKICFATTIIGWLLHKVDPSRVWNCMRNAHSTPILLCLVLSLFTIVISGWRWQQMLALFDIRTSLKPLICITQIGQFFSMFLPGPSGDDLTRMLYISRLAKNRIGEACTSVVIDRLIGLASILVLALLCIPRQWHLLSQSRETFWLAGGIMATGLATCIFGAVFFLAGHPTRRWFERRLQSLPAHTLRDEFARIWGLLCDNKRTVSRVFAAATGTQLLNCMLFYLAGSSVGIHASLLTWMSIVPIVLVANAVPITVAGIGVREYLLVLFLGVLAQVDEERALAASLIVFSTGLAFSLLGGAVYIFYRPKGEAI